MRLVLTSEGDKTHHLFKCYRPLGAVSLQPSLNIPSLSLEQVKNLDVRQKQACISIRMNVQFNGMGLPFCCGSFFFFFFFFLGSSFSAFAFSSGSSIVVGMEMLNVCRLLRIICEANNITTDRRVCSWSGVCRCR